MGQRYSVLATTDVVVATTTETVLATISNVSTSRPGSKVVLVANTIHTVGTATTALTYRWRRGTDATGTLIGEADVIQIDTAAGSTEEHTYAVEDAGVDLVNASYVITVQQTAATGNGTALQTEAWADTAP